MKNVKYLMLFHSFVFITLSVCAQDPSELDKRNGFKDIKLMSDVDQYEGLQFKKEDEHDEFKKIAIYTAKKGFYESIGSIKVLDLKVKTYKKEIFEIVVLTEKNPKLYSGLKKVLGEPTYALRGNTYYWSTKNLKLSFMSHSKEKLQLIYHSFLMREKLKAEKVQEVEDIADDF